MMTLRPNRPDGTTSLPPALDSPRAKLVYLYLSTVDDASIDELHDRLDLSKLALYSILRSLRDRDLVATDGDRYACC